MSRACEVLFWTDEEHGRAEVGAADLGDDFSDQPGRADLCGRPAVAENPGYGEPDYCRCEPYTLYNYARWLCADHYDEVMEEVQERKRSVCEDDTCACHHLHDDDYAEAV